MIDRSRDRNRILNEDGSVEIRFYYDDGGSKLKSKRVIKKTFHARYEGDKGLRPTVHRVTEGDKLPWCKSGRRTKGRVLFHKTDDPVDCKLCIKGTVLPF